MRGKTTAVSTGSAVEYRMASFLMKYASSAYASSAGSYQNDGNNLPDIQAGTTRACSTPRKVSGTGTGLRLSRST